MITISDPLILILFGFKPSPVIYQKIQSVAAKPIMWQQWLVMNDGWLGYVRRFLLTRWLEKVLNETRY